MYYEYPEWRKHPGSGHGGAGGGGPGGGGVSGGLPLDVASIGTMAAFSGRKVRYLYSGPCMRVRRGDGVTQDIFFLISGDFDAGSYNAFVGNQTASCAIWYDQTGNGFDVSQPVSTRQPPITLDALNHPVLHFSSTTSAPKQRGVATPTGLTAIGETGVRQRMATGGTQINSALAVSNNPTILVSTKLDAQAYTGLTVSSVVNINNITSGNVCGVANNPAFSVGWQFQMTGSFPGGSTIRLLDQTFTFGSLDSGSSQGDGNYHTDLMRIGASNADGWEDTVLLPTVQTVLSSLITTTTGQPLVVGDDANVTDGPFTGLMREVLVWSRFLTFPENRTIQNGQRAYWGTP